MFIFKDEGFYWELCKETITNKMATITIETPHTYPLNRRHITPIGTQNVATYGTVNNNNESLYSTTPLYSNRTNTNENSENSDSNFKLYPTCQEQETRLNLWFSVAVAFMYICLAFLGQMTGRLGTQVTRHIFTCVNIYLMITILTFF